LWRNNHTRGFAVLRTLDDAALAIAGLVSDRAAVR
jgi:hypothetical protein